MRDDYCRSNRASGVSYHREGLTNARHSEIAPDRHQAIARSEILRICFEDAENVEEITRGYEVAASDGDAAFVERIRHERHGGTATHESCGDGEHGIEVSVGTEAGDYDIQVISCVLAAEAIEFN
jgi:hypothetical protein